MKHKCMLFQYPREGMEYGMGQQDYRCPICGKVFHEPDLAGILGVFTSGLKTGFVPANSTHPLAKEIMFIAPSVIFSPMIEMFICEFKRCYVVFPGRIE
jgi:hypothetical protein